MLLIYLPTLAAAYELGLTDFFTNPGSRGILSAPTIIAYIVVLGPILAGLEPIVIRSLRPNLLVDDQELARIIQRASAVSPLHEAAAIATGLFFGFLIIGGVPGPGESWPTYVWLVTGYMMLGLLGWIGFLSIAGTRVVSQLLRQPMRVDPLDIPPFEAIGRQSLVLALVFVGGITLGIVLGSYGSAALMNPRFWLLILPISLVPVVVFFLNMRPTQRVLAAARNRALAEVQQQLRRALQTSPVEDAERRAGRQRAVGSERPRRLREGTPAGKQLALQPRDLADPDRLHLAPRGHGARPEGSSRSISDRRVACVPRQTRENRAGRAGFSAWPA